MLERGERSPTLNTISQICKSLEISEDEMVRLTLRDAEETDNASKVD